MPTFLIFQLPKYHHLHTQINEKNTQITPCGKNLALIIIPYRNPNINTPSSQHDAKRTKSKFKPFFIYVHIPVPAWGKTWSQFQYWAGANMGVNIYN
jgi:hypothetical protein